MTLRAKYLCLGAASIALAVELAIASRAQTAEPRCERIMPVVDAVDVFRSATDASPNAQMAKGSLGGLCKLEEANGRYRIKLQGRNAWVRSDQFRRSFGGELKPISPTPRQGPAGTAGTAAQQLPAVLRQAGERAASPAAAAAADQAVPAARPKRPPTKSATTDRQ